MKDASPSSLGEVIFAAFWIAVYFFIHYTLTPWLDGINPYAAYGAEAFYAVLAISFFGERRFRLKFVTDRLTLAMIALSLILGATTYKIAVFGGVKIPFDLTQTYTLLALLLIGPILEELVFRQALWYSLETLASRWSRGDVNRRPGEIVAWIMTSSLFALAHFEAYVYVPPEFRAFILYQTAYALLIALWWGRVYRNTGSVGLTMSLHFAFNFGFWLGSVA